MVVGERVCEGAGARWGFWLMEEDVGSRPSSFQKGFLGKNEKQFVYLGKKRRALGLGAHQGNW
jgi:hypothetical protein